MVTIPCTILPNIQMNFSKKIMRPLIFLSLIFANLLTSIAKAETIDCFIVKEADEYLIKHGENCDVRYSPASTFKIPLAVIGYDSGILKDENHPIWESPKSLTFLEDYWSGEKTPSSWMRFSIVWYSQNLTKKLGTKKFQSYVNKFDYGNRDLSGNIGLNDGLSQSWLSSSLLISPNEQLSFITKLAKNQLPVTQLAQEKTKNILRFFEESMLSNGWIIYGKTGTDIDHKTSERRGYFVGFASKNEAKKTERLITFVIHTSGEKNSKVGGIYAKKIAMDEMLQSLLQK